VLKILEESYAKFQRAATSDEDSDKFSLEAVKLLTEGFVFFVAETRPDSSYASPSVQLIPRMSVFTRKEEPSIPVQLEHLIHQFVDSWHQARHQT
jgi:hypothetical protein